MIGIAENHYGDFIGQVIVKIEKSDEEIVFHLENGKIWRMLHYQDCCENVFVDEILGDFDSILNEPIIHTFERTNNGGSCGGSATWTYYTIGTHQNLVIIRWYGTSNGYYSESVDFREDS